MIFKSLQFFKRHHQKPTNFHSIRTFIEDIEIKFVRDRALDHAVEKERDLKPVLNLKNFIKSQPSKSLPLSLIVENKETLKIDARPIEFVRKYPLVFEEYFPGNVGVLPHVRLSEEVLELDCEERLIHESDSFRRDAGDRLLKLLMLCRVHEIPLRLIDGLKWDLGLPDDYAETLVPEFPDYFQVKRGKLSSMGVSGRDGCNEGLLELVCWSNDLAVSVMEKRAVKEKSFYQKGMPIAFPLRFSKGFEMDKRLKKWIDEWQRLPYVSPYENASHLQPNSDESDKWAVGILHELLNLLVSKKTERDNVLRFGEYLGIRSRFKRAIVHHPGIFYLSSKIDTYTVVLRDAYKRDLLIEKHPLMNMRSKYIHLMHSVKEVQKPKGVPIAIKQSKVQEVGAEGKEENESRVEQDEETNDSDSDFDVETQSEDEDEDSSKRVALKLGRGTNRRNIEGRSNVRTASQRPVRRHRTRT